MLCATSYGTASRRRPKPDVGAAVPDWRPEKRVRDPEALRNFRLEHVGETCAICELRLGIELHHKIFRSGGGGDVESNLIWVCRFCHDDIHAGRLDRYVYE